MILLIALFQTNRYFLDTYICFAKQHFSPIFPLLLPSLSPSISHTLTSLKPSMPPSALFHTTLLLSGTRTDQSFEPLSVFLNGHDLQ